MQQSLKNGAAGLGLKRELISQIQESFCNQEIPGIDFLEIAPENWIGAGGKAANQLGWISEHFALVCHGLSLSLGGPDPLNVNFLLQVKKFLDAHQISLYTEHLSYCAADGYMYDLLPIPFTEEAVHHVAERIKQTQDILGRRIAVENTSYYVASPITEMDELSFIKAVIEEADCNWHLDVNNVYVNSVNFGFDPQDFLQKAADENLGKRIVYAHTAGHYQEAPDLLIDTHGELVIEPVWELLAQAYRLFGVFPTLLERDTNIPSLLDLMPEILRIKALQNSQGVTVI